MRALLPVGRNTLREAISGGIRSCAVDVMLKHALPHKQLKIKELIETLDAAKGSVADARLPPNANTPDELLAEDLRS